ncbi:hypothetical protein FJ420_33050 [Mesorhizobium sp. B3-1-3]|nr:hypothetical protein FJ424_33065 [Mesorhizobium sp. B3-1-8]TPI58453.1 hypothetical protein FJ420_33050 [Mesorhizobium sp. B3-1-3]
MASTPPGAGCLCSLISDAPWKQFDAGVAISRASLLDHDLFQKPVPTFWDHALAAGIHSGFADRARCLFKPFSSGKKIDRANPTASGGMEFHGVCALSPLLLNLAGQRPPLSCRTSPPPWQGYRI